MPAAIKTRPLLDTARIGAHVVGERITRPRTTDLADVPPTAEAQFYSEIRPRLDVDSPRVLYAAWDRSSGRSLILFVDVAATRGVTFADPTETYVDW